MTDALTPGDIQGIVIRGYGALRAAVYVMLEIASPRDALSWLRELDHTVTNGQTRPGDTALNIAFTAGGLRKLGLSPQILQMFSHEFQEGMVTPFRTRILGDEGAGAPERWGWGGPSTAPVDLALLMFARDSGTLSTLYASQAAAFTARGLKETVRLDTSDLGDREHFGFRDGISQPIIPGLSKTGTPASTVKAGEFILGYSNEYGLYTDRPLVQPRDDPNGVLPLDPAGSGNRDLGRNGSYLVFRQLSQDVAGFWKFVEQSANEAGESGRTEASIRLAAKMVGRWPSGAPLVLAPDRDDPKQASANDFNYFHTDVNGVRCPLGAHIRRTNPRDSLDPQPGSQASIDVGKRHRLLRRGREYGAAISQDSPVSDQQATPGQDRGLHFICLNANISRQFEFVQHTWINNPKFHGLYDDSDPLIATHQLHGGTFTIQADPVRKNVKALPQFVTVRGGAYFFLPGMRAIRYLAGLQGV